MITIYFIIFSFSCQVHTDFLKKSHVGHSVCSAKKEIKWKESQNADEKSLYMLFLKMLRYSFRKEDGSGAFFAFEPILLSFRPQKPQCCFLKKKSVKSDARASRAFRAARFLFGKKRDFVGEIKKFAPND